MPKTMASALSREVQAEPPPLPGPSRPARLPLRPRAPPIGPPDPARSCCDAGSSGFSLSAPRGQGGNDALRSVRVAEAPQFSAAVGPRKEGKPPDSPRGVLPAL